MPSEHTPSQVNRAQMAAISFFRLGWGSSVMTLQPSRVLAGYSPGRSSRILAIASALIGPTCDLSAPSPVACTGNAAPISRLLETKMRVIHMFFSSSVASESTWRTCKRNTAFVGVHRNR
ncbi:hypothetical protein D3C86_1418130 [compost metagenome]